jgi:hypothetical protein
MAEERKDRGRLPNLIALVLAMTTSVVLYFVPVGTKETSTATQDGAPSVTTREQIRLSEITGYSEAGTIVLLLIPVAITALPLVVKKKGLLLGMAALLTLLCFLAGFSIGLFYVPAAIALWVAARRSAAA